MKLILTADLHLGRCSSGLPSTAMSRNPTISCRMAWERIVQLAISEQADALLVAGDLIEESRAYYESLGPLMNGFEKLQEKGIHFLAVAGNHDAKAFERIAKDCEGMEGIHFMGRDGKWERVAIEKDGQDTVFVDGWSFPDHRYPGDPTDGYTLGREDGIPIVGLLHADLGNTASTYAPVTADNLRRRPPDFWLLGHIHKPAKDERDSEATILYPGSPQAMDFGETGWHGVWSLDTGKMELVKHQISSIRYENSLEISVAADDNRESVENTLKEAALEHISSLAPEERGPLECVIYRSRINGEWENSEVLEALSLSLPEFELPDRDGLKACFDGRLEDRTELPIDLEREAGSSGAIGRLARRLAILQSDDWSHCSWFEEIHNATIKDYDSCRIEGDDEVSEDGHRLFAPPVPEETRAALIRQAKNLLIAAKRETA